MTFAESQEATNAYLVFDDHFDFDINDLNTVTEMAVEAFDIAPPQESEVTASSATTTFGPVEVSLTRDTDENQNTRIGISVRRLRDSETLHPDAETAILAEILSLMAEYVGGDRVEWAGDLCIPVNRFLTAFTPLRLRGGSTRISPRRVRPGDTCGTPILLPVQPERAAMEGSETSDGLRDVFLHEDLTEAKPRANLSSVSAWAATASVGVFNPAIGVPLAAYNLARGAELRVSTHAFALTATISGLIGSNLAQLSVF